MTTETNFALVLSSDDECFQSIILFLGSAQCVYWPGKHEKSGNLKETPKSQGICVRSQGICDRIPKVREKSGNFVV